MQAGLDRQRRCSPRSLKRAKAEGLQAERLHAPDRRPRSRGRHDHRAVGPAGRRAGPRRLSALRGHGALGRAEHPVASSPEWGSIDVRIPLEQDAVFTRAGVRFLDRRQTELILVR
ncbi:MAG: hypothetical protein M0C28_33000 [Candidatus Moduliflexus flocculans]|nr:hypothetical protein [Candidatus Moduliflexus flocculans]